MPRKVFTAGEVLAAADVNEFLQDQAVMTFAGTAARGSAIPTPVDGMLTYLEDSDTYESYTAGAYVTVADGTGWTTFVPTLGSVTIGNGVFNYAKYKVIGKIGHVQVKFTLGSTSAVTGDIQLDVPTDIARINIDAPGNVSAIFRDANTALGHSVTVIGSAATRVKYFLRATNSSGTYLSTSLTSSTIPFTWATSDEIIFSATYEVA